MIEALIGIGGFVLGAILATLYSRPIKTENAQHRSTIETLNAAKQTLESASITLREDIARLKAEKDALEQRMAQQKADEDTLMGRFENLSNKIFEAKGEKFKQQSQEGLNLLLTPLKEKIGEFQKKIDESFGEQAKEQRSLKDQIKNIVDINTRMTLQAESLANALKGDSKVQGNWGEYILEKLLEDSGLRKDEDYILQGAGMNLVDQDNRQQRPDVIINLPENRHIVIDSKLTLTSYERFFSEADDTQRPVHLTAFKKSVRDRVLELEKTGYQDNEKLGTPDFVLMFVPIEGAYALAVQNDPALHEYAWAKRVVIVSPTTLFATMRTIASIWRLERQNRNVQEIARQGGALYDKIAGLLTDMSSLGAQLQKVGSVYENAMKKLSTGQGNIVTRIEKLKALGAKTTKSLPKDFFAEGPEAAEIAALLEEPEEILDRETGT